jgi:hypothetical protein
MYGLPGQLMKKSDNDNINMLFAIATSQLCYPVAVENLGPLLESVRDFFAKIGRTVLITPDSRKHSFSNVYQLSFNALMLFV